MEWHSLQLPLYAQAGAECLPRLSARCPICFPTKVWRFGSNSRPKTTALLHVVR